MRSTKISHLATLFCHNIIFTFDFLVFILQRDLLELTPFDAKKMIQINTDPVSLKLEGANVGRGVKWSEDMQGFVKEQDIITLDVIVWYVLEFEHYKLPVLSHGQFHDGDTYVVRWQYMIANASKSIVMLRVFSHHHYCPFAHIRELLLPPNPGYINTMHESKQQLILLSVKERTWLQPDMKKIKLIKKYAKILQKKYMYEYIARTAMQGNKHHGSLTYNILNMTMKTLKGTIQ